MSTQTISNLLASCTNLSAESSEQNSTFDYTNLNTSIQETFTAIDRFEWQAVDEILLMREQQLYPGFLTSNKKCLRGCLKSRRDGKKALSVYAVNR
ncbi:ATPase involved in DNA repair (plasmid) [Nostoc flagelliforme CCNUN1]|uniref:ATPase involved in DNA repair n=1 Tax=Nostoc flagelliforme CCNUN1 TaxID=2038116 RepID=A0A2K8T6H3_9NOSO|nr:hypothetical protein [Nostoc flagelliforme]AUB43183.1 ATPase involved in DNA repair [Nostoc flagelliforme CCNUN1]